MIDKILTYFPISNYRIFSCHLSDLAQNCEVPWHFQIACQQIALFQVGKSEIFKFFRVVQVQFQDNDFDGELRNGFTQMEGK